SADQACAHGSRQACALRVSAGTGGRWMPRYALRPSADVQTQQYGKAFPGSPRTWSMPQCNNSLALLRRPRSRTPGIDGTPVARPDESARTGRVAARHASPLVPAVCKELAMIALFQGLGLL